MCICLLFVKYHSKLRYRYVYLVYKGELAGGTILYVKEEDIGETAAILVFSPTESIYINKKEIEDFLANGDMRPAKKLPKKIYNACREQFIYKAKKAGKYANR